jgi:hypothetical protein
MPRFEFAASTAFAFSADNVEIRRSLDGALLRSHGTLAAIAA